MTSIYWPMSTYYLVAPRAVSGVVVLTVFALELVGIALGVAWALK